MPDTIDLSALIISRVCHDLISPIGAIGNGVELLMMEDQQSAPEHELIGEAVSQATARLKLFRLAFGSSRSDLRIAGGDLVQLFDVLTRGGRTALSMDCDKDLPREEVKLALLLLLCLEHALPWGGQIAFVQDGENWNIHAQARRMRLPKRLWAQLNGPTGPSLSVPPPIDGQMKDDQSTSDIDPNEVQFFLLEQQLKKLDRVISGKLQQSQLELGF